MGTFVAIVVGMILVFAIGFFVGVASGYAVLKTEYERVDQKETEKLEDSPKYGFAAKM